MRPMLLLLCVLTLAACGGGEPAHDASNTQPVAPTSATVILQVEGMVRVEGVT